MNQAEWVNCTDPVLMLEYLRERESERKLRLFLCACARQLWHLLADEESRQAIHSIERSLDWPNSSQALHDAHSAARTAAHRQERLPHKEWNDNAFVRGKAAWEVANIISDIVYRDWRSQRSTERVIQCNLIRDIFSFPPSLDMQVSPSWLAWNGGTIPRIAQQIDEEGAFDQFSILADALEDAGCTETNILDHCRSPGPHVRGCWVTDLLLGKK
jgi:hypothetical protein